MSLHPTSCVLCPESCILCPESCILHPEPRVLNHVFQPSHLVSSYLQKHQTSSTLAWRQQPRVNGRFVSRSRADTITPNETSLHDTESSISSSPSTESLLTQSSYDSPFDGFLGLDNPFTESPPVPTNSPVPQPERTKKLLMPLESIPEFAGTQDDTIQPADFLKVIK